jgi:hypothetical protein
MNLLSTRPEPRAPAVPPGQLSPARVDPAAGKWVAVPANAVFNCSESGNSRSYTRKPVWITTRQTILVLQHLVLLVGHNVVLHVAS